VTFRQKLTWFALGVFSSGALSMFATVMLRPTVIYEPKVSYLILEEPSSRSSFESDFDRSLIAYQIGAILRECGARYFETTVRDDDHSPTADLPLFYENVDALPCVVRTAQKQEITIRTEIRWVDNLDLAALLRNTEPPPLADDD
jgi:hypothetical protein